MLMHSRIGKGTKFPYWFHSDSRYERTGLFDRHDDEVRKFIFEEAREIREWVEMNVPKGRYKFEVHKSWFSGAIHRKRYVVWLMDQHVAAAFKIRWC